MSVNGQKTLVNRLKAFRGAACFRPLQPSSSTTMELPQQTASLGVEEIEDLARHFSAFRHDVNGCLALVVAATELIRYNPAVVTRMAATLIEQPPRIAGKTREFVACCERILGLRPPATASWYEDLWKRSNAAASDPTGPISISPEEAKQIYGEFLTFAKELTQVAFTVSGAGALAAANPLVADEVSRTAAEQLPKATRRFAEVAALLEKAFKMEPPPPKRLLSGAPSGPLTLGPDQLAAFRRRLSDLQEDINEHLMPLVELSRLARDHADQIGARSQEFAQQPTRLSETLSRFATDFDKALGIVRTAS